MVPIGWVDSLVLTFTLKIVVAIRRHDAFDHPQIRRVAIWVHPCLDFLREIEGCCPNDNNTAFRFYIFLIKNTVHYVTSKIMLHNNVIFGVAPNGYTGTTL